MKCNKQFLFSARHKILAVVSPSTRWLPLSTTVGPGFVAISLRFCQCRASFLLPLHGHPILSVVPVFIFLSPTGSLCLCLQGLSTQGLLPPNFPLTSLLKLVQSKLVTDFIRPNIYLVPTVCKPVMVGYMSFLVIQLHQGESFVERKAWSNFMNSLLSKALYVFINIQIKMWFKNNLCSILIRIFIRKHIIYIV